MFFNHHKYLKDIGITLKDGIVPKSQKDFKLSFWKFKRYFSLKRLKKTHGLFDIIFDIEWGDYKDNVEQHYQMYYAKEVEDIYNIRDAKFNLYRTLIYIKDSIRDEIKGWYKVFINKWKYGFSDRETFDLDHVTSVYLYERLKRYKELASDCIYLYPESKDGVLNVDSLHKFQNVPVIELNDIETIKDTYNNDIQKFYSDDSAIVKVEYKDLYQYECIDLILDYLEKALKSDNGDYIFDYNYNGHEIDCILDENRDNPFETYNKQMNEKYPDHMFYFALEERYSDLLTSYAFQIYGKIINACWW